MYKIGIDVGSTYTKYCIMDADNQIIKLYSERSPIRQKEYFDKKINELKSEYESLKIVSCGYGRENISSVKNINELTALAIGVNYLYPEENVVLDIGGQDTKLIKQKKGKLADFILNDKCAAGSGLFLNNTCNTLGMSMNDIRLLPFEEVKINLSSVCAVFAQSEIVELIANNVDEQMIISAVVKQIIIQTRMLLQKKPSSRMLLSGGLSKIEGIQDYIEKILEVECVIGDKNSYLSAIGCSLISS